MIPIFNLLTPYHPPAPALNSSSKSPPEENGEESSEQPEDILATTIPFLDPHYAHNMHGDPGAAVLYDSRAFGKLRLKLCDPGQESERQLFAHYVWNASFVLAECIGKGWWWEGLVKGEEEEGKDGEERRRRGEKGEVKGGARLRREDWSVQGESVLELGAGSGLTSIIAALSGAASVVATDYPSPALLSVLRENAEACNSKTISSPPSSPSILHPTPALRAAEPNLSVQGHEWGTSLKSEPWALAYAHTFSRVVAADTLWLPAKHAALAASMAHFLRRGPESRVWVAAGFHSGRERLGMFFKEAEKVGLAVRRRWEVDVEGWEREWVDDRGEGFGEAARWTVIAVLGWRGEDNAEEGKEDDDDESDESECGRCPCWKDALDDF